jgi:hypothetical protein
MQHNNSWSGMGGGVDSAAVFGLSSFAIGQLTFDYLVNPGRDLTP